MVVEQSVWGQRYRAVLAVIRDGSPTVEVAARPHPIEVRYAPGLALASAVREVVARLDHRFINDLAPFDALNPSAENLAKYFYDEISARLPGSTRLGQVKIWETDITSATYRP